MKKFILILLITIVSIVGLFVIGHAIIRPVVSKVVYDAAWNITEQGECDIPVGYTRVQDENGEQIMDDRDVCIVAPRI